MSKRERVLAALALVVVIAGLSIAWWVLHASPEESASGAAPLEEDEAELAQWGLVAPGRRPRAVSTASEAPASRGPRPDDPEWQARRERWQERWRRAVSIVSLGPSAPGIEPEQIRGALSPGRDALRGCIRDAGGWRALREARRAERGTENGEALTAADGEEGSGRRGGRSRRRVSFDVRPDGTVEPNSIEMAPPVADAFDPCFRTFFSSARFEAVGEDGAHVELPMGPPGGRGGRFSGDGGVPGERRDWGRDRDRRRGPPSDEPDPEESDRGGAARGAARTDRPEDP